jgi:hypothetical protein
MRTTDRPPARCLPSGSSSLVSSLMTATSSGFRERTLRSRKDREQDGVNMSARIEGARLGMSPCSTPESALEHVLTSKARSLGVRLAGVSEQTSNSMFSKGDGSCPTDRGFWPDQSPPVRGSRRKRLEQRPSHLCAQTRNLLPAGLTVAHESLAAVPASPHAERVLDPAAIVLNLCLLARHLAQRSELGQLAVDVA